MREQRTTYSGPAEIWVDGEKVHDVEVILFGFVDVIEVQTFGGLIVQDGATSWGGHLEGLTEGQQIRLIGHTFELRLQNGQTGQAVLADIEGTVSGIRETPF